MRACRSGVAPVLLTLWGGRAAQQNRDLLLRAQRALKEGVVIRKRQGEPFWFPLLLCARRPHRPHFPVKYGHIRCPFSRNAPIGRAMRALRVTSSKQHASRKQKKRRTPSVPPPLVREAAAQAAFPREARAHTLPLQPKRPNRARNARPYETRAVNNTPPESQKRGEPHRVLLFSIFQSLTVCKPAWSRTPRTPF